MSDSARPDVALRPHRDQDLPWIVERHAALYRDSHGWDETFEAMVADIVREFTETHDPDRERCWIAWVDGRRAGAVALVRRSDREAQLRLLFLEPWARGRGVGKRLVSTCVETARDLGYRSMVLHTVRGLDAAKALYESEGFVLVHEEPKRAFGKEIVDQGWRLEL